MTHLFKRSLHLAENNIIYFEKRGSRNRQEPLTEAVRKSSKLFKEKYSTTETNVSVKCQTPVGEPCLQVIDYHLWAIQRLFLRKEDRFYKSIEHQIEFVWDLYGENYPKNIFTKNNPLKIEKISPL